MNAKHDRPVIHLVGSTRASVYPQAQFTIAALLKLLLVVAVICATVQPTLGIYWTFVAMGAAVGMFVAEYFAVSKPSEFIALFVVPLMFSSVAMLWGVLATEGQLSWLEYGGVFLLGALVGIVPIVVSVVVISVLVAIVDQITGIRLLKYHWNTGVETRRETTSGPR